jgi:hypothetical protein
MVTWGKKRETFLIHPTRKEKAVKRKFVRLHSQSLWNTGLTKLPFQSKLPHFFYPTQHFIFWNSRGSFQHKTSQNSLVMFASKRNSCYDEGLSCSRLNANLPVLILFPTPQLDWHFTYLSSDPSASICIVLLFLFFNSVPLLKPWRKMPAERGAAYLVFLSLPDQKRGRILTIKIQAVSPFFTYRRCQR